MKNVREIIMYGIFGVLTTILNIFSYWALTRFLNLSTVAGTVWAWLIAVFFAYATNRKYVFHSENNSIKSILSELISFLACRLATGIMDVVIMYLFVDVFKFNDVIIKTISNILVIIFNYIASKLLIFKKKNL